MHALITGAGGFIGGALTQAFADAGWTVSALYRKRAPAPRADVTVIKAELEDLRPAPRSFDVLVHCASEVPAHCPDPGHLYRTNVEGTRNLLVHGTNAGARGMIYLSSMAVYGASVAPLIDERTPLAPADSYGRSKADCEALVAAWAVDQGAGALSLRLPGIVGRGARNNFLCDSLQLIRSGDTVTARNPDALFNNVVHVTDLARFIVSIAARLTAGHRALTVAADDPLPLREVLARLFRHVGVPERISWQPGGRPSFLIGFEQARALGYRPATVADSLERFVADSA